MRRHLVALVLLASLLPPVGAVEKWADPALPVGQGVVLWLDAARQPDAWKAHGRPALASGAALDVFYDASGNRLHLQQRVQAMQPRFVVQGASLATIRYDGKQCLGLTGAPRFLQEFSLFLVAAPRRNPGGFSGLFACHEAGKNDFLSGCNVDLGPFATPGFDWLNVEGRGFVGAANLMKQAQSFAGLRLIEVHCRPGAQGIQMRIDGAVAGSRKRTEEALRADNFVLGARCYSNSGDPPFLQGFLEGDIAEVLLFERALAEEESARLRKKLLAKHAGWTPPPPERGHLPQRVGEPPPVQMFVPGFTVRELPVDLPNINNLRYRDDGKLVALGYGGNIYVLSDSDGDGLEDRAEMFWENKTGLRGPIGMALTPKGYARGRGAFVPSKGKVSLIVDTNGDDRADKEVVIAEGWKEIAQAVDATGIAIDREGYIYFGLGCTNFANAYLKTPDGKAAYDIKSERGTIQKLWPDFSKRETICTGIRFPVGHAINRHGDLFVTDQEGATWLPNGNPFDELLHIQRGRHYGFPPRHPQILPGVIDEPSVFDYGPQHQSTCGFCFNDSVNGGPTFGPADWAGDALVTGESRGKLYRTRLVKTPHGYVAQNHLLAALQMLTVDACVSPRGDLLVCCHSGPPDWGTGPGGKGKLFCISYADRQTALPLFAYAAGPTEVRVPFDRPLDTKQLQDIARKVRIEYGPYVAAGDRFEHLQPPYQVVKNQLATPRQELPVHGVQVTPDWRTLVLTTASHPEVSHYALTLPTIGVPHQPLPRELSQQRTIDLAYDLTGVSAVWEGDGGKSWSGWLPHLDLGVAQQLTAGSADHAQLWQALATPGKLTLSTRLDLRNMLRPEVQPGAAIDYTWPAERVSVSVLPQPVMPQPDELYPAVVDIATGAGRLNTPVHFSTQEDATPRPLPLRRLLLPWATLKPTPVLARAETPELQGGQWARGREIFFSDTAACSKCHLVRGEGGKIGPDLSNLVHRDYDSVLRDIRTPSAAINPDYLAHLVTLKDGRTFTGTLRSEGGRQLIGTNEGKEIAFRSDELDGLSAAPISTMPEGLDKKLSAEQFRDLMTFLLTEPLQPAKLERDGAPPPRKQAEVAAALAGREPLSAPLKKLHIVLAAGPKDHGPGEHDYPLWQRRWANLLETAPQVNVSTALGWPTRLQWDTADIIVFYSHHAGWGADKGSDLDAFLARGGGLVYIHWAVAGKDAAEALADRIGLAAKAIKFRHGPLEVTFDGKHPIARNFSKVQFVDESYWMMTGDPARLDVLGSGVEEGQPRPLFWTREQGQGRVFVSIPGHYTWTFDDPLFRLLLLRGMAWTAGQPIDRWADLATVGARVE